VSALRLLGLVIAAGLFVAAVRGYRRRDISRLSLIIGVVLSVGLALLATVPGLFDPVFETFNLRAGNHSRLIAVLLGSTIIVFLLLFRLQTESDRNERAIRQLVEAMGVERFEWSLAEARVAPGPKIITVSPAHNEAENVAAVIHAMPEDIDGLRVVSLVIDDCSEDETAEAARRAGALVARLPIRRGGGLALRVGYEIALSLGAQVVVTIDADGQHLPEEMSQLVKPILEDQADHVNGSRMLGDYERGPLVRHIGVHFFSWVVTLLTGQRVTDISSGYRATRAETLRKLILEQDQFWTSEVTIEALRHHARVVEVPVTFLTRRGGESKKPRTLRYAWNFAKAIGKTWLR
jgi:hypothetical protein